MQIAPLLPVTPDHAVVLRVAERVREEGGRLLLVGGFVRDAILSLWGRGSAPKDLDVEVFGVPLPRLRELLAQIGPVDEVGASFGVLRVRGVDVDFSLPRADRKVAGGHRGFLVDADPSMSVAQAAQRRDFTVNAISADPLTGELLDPLGGLEDLRLGLLRAADDGAFIEDPLRALRGAQFAARMRLEPAPGLTALMGAQDLSELPSERVFDEVRKLLLRGVEPSRGLRLLADAGLLGALPGLASDVLDVAAPALDRWVASDLGARPERSLAEGLALLLAGRDGDQGRLLDRLKPPLAVAAAARALDGALDWAGDSAAVSGRSTARGGPDPQAQLATSASPGDADLRREARHLAAAGTSWASLLRIRRALHPDEASAIALLADRTDALGVLHAARSPAVLGRHALARGIAPGPDLGDLLARCLAEQDRSGVEDPELLLDRVAASDSAR